MRFWTTLLLGLSLTQPALICQEPAEKATPAALQFAPSVSDAYAQAKREKKPVVWIVMKDEEIACTRMLGIVYADEKIRKKCAEFVLLPSSLYEHATAPVVVQGKTLTSCTHFPGVTCAEHQAIEKEMRTRFEESSEVIAPQHIVTDADGKLLLRKPYEMDVPQLLAFLERAQRHFRGESDAPPAVALPPGATPPPDAELGLSAEDKRLIAALTAAPDEERLSAAKELAGRGKGATAALASALLGDSIKPEALRLKILRALGQRECANAAKDLCPGLESKSMPFRNSLVVTLEEMSNPVAVEPLLELWKKEKDPETKKDILRALGPTGVGNENAKKLLLEQLKGKDDAHRVASAIALSGHSPGAEDVQAALVERWKKEPGNELIKFAILFGISQSRDNELALKLAPMLKDEKNGEVKSLAETVLAGVTGSAPPDAGRGRGGGGGRGGRGGPEMAIFRAGRRLFESDKIERNVVKEFRERFGNRGGRGG